MRVRTAKQRAQRIDLNYFKYSRGMRRLRILLSIALPAAAVLWIGGIAVAGNRRPFSAGPVSGAHAFAEKRCEVCHMPANPTAGFRVHTTDTACLTCHDAPVHAANQTTPPPCSSCHQDHRGRVQLAKTDDRFCVGCHGDLKTTHGDRKVVTVVRSFPSGHPEFAAVRPGAPQDPTRVRFNHSVHLKGTLRGPNGPEILECTTCHKPEVTRAAANRKKAAVSGLMAPISYQQQCARCHPLFFDERISLSAPHDTPERVYAFVQQALIDYGRQNPKDISRSDDAVRRVPLNFPRPVEPPARTPEEWVARRAAVDERVLWNKTCAECHDKESAGTDQDRLPVYAKTNIPRQWMARAVFDHAPHALVRCASCHAAQGSAKTSDVLMPKEAVCATCHEPAKGAEYRCFECHRYHDWAKTHPVRSSYTLTDFK
jgi:predicted CXXCH cytochrome family protein